MAKDTELKIWGRIFTQAHAKWDPQGGACVVTGTSAFRWSILINLIVDLSLLCIMFAGVLQKKNATRLWRMLYFQGIFWILSAIFTEVPCVVSHRRRCTILIPNLIFSRSSLSWT